MEGWRIALLLSSWCLGYTSTLAISIRDEYKFYPEGTRYVVGTFGIVLWPIIGLVFLANYLGNK